MHLSSVYTNGCAYGVMYSTGIKNEYELYDEIFTTEEKAASLAKEKAKQSTYGQTWVVCLWLGEVKGKAKLQHVVYESIQ